MSKRSRGGGSLTGGTGDVNPQFMSFHTVQTGNDAATGGSVQPPVSLSTGERLAMEILRVWVETGAPPNASSSLTFWLSTKNFGTTGPVLGLGDATVLVHDGWNSTFTTSGVNLLRDVVQYDLTDGAGHGVLVGNQNLYWGINSVTTTATQAVNWKILYRAKKISQSELLGIVLQSNQN